MGGANSRPTVVKQRRLVTIRSGSCLVDLLLEGKYDECISKVRSEAGKEVCVKLQDGQERWVLPLHIACASPEVPLKVFRSLLTANPSAMMHHTTVHKLRKKENDVGFQPDASQTSSVSSLDGNTWGVGWLPLHVAAHYGAKREAVELLLKDCPQSVYCKTTDGHLAIHIASSKVETSQHLLEPLIDAFPLSIYVSTSEGMTARELAEARTREASLPCMELLLPNPAVETQSEHQPRRSHKIPASKRPSTLKKMVSVAGRLEANRETALFEALSNRRWSNALDLLLRKPKDAKLWTLSSDPIDPPCHLLPLHMALRRKAPIGVVQALLNANPSAVYRREFYGMLPVHVACEWKSNLPIVRLLCEAYQDATRQPDLRGRLPLHLACASLNGCQLSVVKYLLSVNPGALAVKDGEGRRPLECCIETDRQLLAHEFDRGEAFWSAKEIQKNELSLLICQKQWNDALDRLKENPEEAMVWTIHPVIRLRYLPLHYACIVHAPTDLVEALLELHPDAASTKCEGHDMLPLHLACQHSARPGVVNALLGVYQDAAAMPDAFALLPLHLACTQGACASVIETLITANPDAIKAVDNNGHTPKVYAQTVVHPHSKKVLSMLDMIRQP